MTDVVPTPAALRETLVEILAGAAGGTAEGWRAAIGDVERLPTWANVRSNWAVHPTGTTDRVATIAKAVAIVREAHPYVAA